MSTAAVDQRLDAIVPVIAWNSLRPASTKADTISLRGSTHLLVGATRPGNTFSPSILKGREQARKGTTFSSEVVDFALLQVLRRCCRRSPPTLIYRRGTIDDLFPPSEAIENHNALPRASVPVKMVWFCGGHGVCLTKGGASKLPLEQTWTWLDKYLKGNTLPTLDLASHGSTSAANTAARRATPDRTLTAKGKGTLALKKNGGSGPYRQVAR